jgi:MFS transporter, ACS family, solute carrier family 17 (sodium-dependent inorganic phosphate cotransporter), other
MDADAFTRRRMVLLCAACCLLNYADRVNISVVILPMAGEYGWSTSDQAAVMSAFFFGYLIMQFGGAVLSRRFGAKAVLTVGATLWSAFTALTPLAASAGFLSLLCCRFCMGLAEGVAFPAIYHFLAGWIPSAERGRAVSVFLTGAHAGTTVALLVSPHIVVVHSWQMVFWSFGAAGVLWIAAWHSLASDKVAEGGALYKPLQSVNDGPPASPRGAGPSPKRSPKRSPSSEWSATAPGAMSLPTDKAAPAFWTGKLVSPSERRAVSFILTSPPCLAVCFTQFSLNLVHYTVLSWLPTYFFHVFDVKVASLSVTAVPYVAMAVCCNVGGWGADHLTSRGMSLTRVRKSVTALSCAGAATFFILFSLAPTMNSALACVTLGLCFQSLGTGGFESSYLDMAQPSLAGTFKSVANTLGALSGCVAMPYTTLVLYLSGGSWRMVFALLCVFHVASMGVFISYATSKRVLVEGDSG